MNERILFVCTGNIARSQIAEGLARSLTVPGVDVASAGSSPNPKGIHPFAIQVLSEKGIDASGQRPKRIGDVPGEFDYVITLCDDAARNCPVLPARHERIHWSIPDPAVAGTNSQTQLAFFREIRDDIERRLREWLGAHKLLRETQ